MIKYGLLLIVLSTSLLLQAQNERQNQQAEFNIKAMFTSEAVKVDGTLDDACWQHAQSVGDFWMSFPTDNAKVSQELQSEVMVSYDDNNLYVAARCYGGSPYIMTTLKRDNEDFWEGKYSE